VNSVDWQRAFESGWLYQSRPGQRGFGCWSEFTVDVSRTITAPQGFKLVRVPTYLPTYLPIRRAGGPPALCVVRLAAVPTLTRQRCACL
jgi:hypothetical protein